MNEKKKEPFWQKNNLSTYLVASLWTSWTKKKRKQLHKIETNRHESKTDRGEQSVFESTRDNILSRTFGLPSMKYFLLSPPTTTPAPNMGTMTARAEKVAETILSSVSRRPSNIWGMHKTILWAQYMTNDRNTFRRRLIRVKEFK